MAKKELESLLTTDGYCVLEGFLTERQVESSKEALYSLQASREPRPNELGVLRLMMDDDPYFLFLLELPQMVEIVDRIVGNTSILHVQNGFILPSLEDTPSVFQNKMHMDFPRMLNGYVASVNVLVALDDFSEKSGGTKVCRGSQQKPEYKYWEELDVTCKAGDAIVFDSTLWHCAGINRSGKDRCAINHQFTKPWIKQQIDYPRALSWLEPDLSERTKQLLGFYSRVPSSLEEYYRVPRLYQAGQG